MSAITLVRGRGRPRKVRTPEEIAEAAARAARTASREQVRIFFESAGALRCHTGHAKAHGALYSAALSTLALRPDLLARLVAHISPCPLTGCWWWDGPQNGIGYGRATVWRVHFVAHRLIYALDRGVPPDDLECDHLCRQRGCVNPRHIELVTHEENVRRSAICHPELIRSAA